jgi:DNA-binding FadR family transcriptional regulator
VPDTLKPINRAPLIHIEVQSAIKDYIQQHNLQANDALPSEGDLAKALEVSRSSVREAVKALESMGILTTRRGSGVFVKAFSFEPLLNNLPYGLMGDVRDITELLDIRRILELAKVDAAIEHLSPEQLSSFDTILGKMKKIAEQGKSFPEADREFHCLLFQNLGNAMLLNLIDVFWVAVRKASEHLPMSDPTPLKTYQDHVAIVEALKAKDVARARAALDHHYEGISVRLKDMKFKEVRLSKA